ncbi:MAG: DUF6785 family protein [Brevinematia bacterium]
MAGTFSASLSIGQWPSGASTYLKGLLPSWLVCFDPIASARYFEGGGEPIWSAYIGPIISWSLIFISIGLVGLSLAFLFLGPELFETEHLPFPYSVPTRYVVNNVYTEDPNKFGDLFFNIKQHKIFWVGVLIGFLLNAPYVIAQIVPAIPLGAMIGGGYGAIPLSAVLPGLTPLIQSIFPNAQYTAPMVSIAIIVTFLLLPFESLTTLLFWIFVVYWIYPGVITRAGILAPGASVWWSWPFPLAFYAQEAAPLLGFGLLMLLMIRGRIKKAFSSFKQDYEINGMSVRTLLSLGIVGAILFLLIWIVAGTDPISAVLLWLVLLIINIGGTAMLGYIHDYGGCPGYNAWKYVWPISSGIGLLPTTAPSTSANAAAFGYMVATSGTCVGVLGNNNSFNSSAVYLNLFVIGADTKVDLRRLLLYALTTLVFLAPFAFFFDAWFNSHVGISNTSQSSMDMFWWNPASAALGLGVQSMTWAAGPMPIWQQAVGQLIVALFIFASYFISARFPVLAWIFNPVGVVLSTNAGWWSWPAALIALVTKYTLNRIVGPRRSFEVSVELVAGLGAGFSLMYLILGAYVFSTISLPNLGLLWK